MAQTDLGFLDLAALARETGKSRRTIRRWFREGRLPRHQLGGLVGCFKHELLRALGADDNREAGNHNDNPDI